MGVWDGEGGCQDSAIFSCAGVCGKASKQIIPKQVRILVAYKNATKSDANSNRGQRLHYSLSAVSFGKFKVIGIRTR